MSTSKLYTCLKGSVCLRRTIGSLIQRNLKEKVLRQDCREHESFQKMPPKRYVVMFRTKPWLLSEKSKGGSNSGGRSSFPVSNQQSLLVSFNLKVIISKIFISLSFAAPMAISGNCRCVFGLHFPSFIVCSHRPFLCLFGHSNYLLTTLAETGKNSTPLHTQVSWRARLLCLKPNCAPLVIFPVKSPPTPRL